MKYRGMPYKNIVRINTKSKALQIFNVDPSI